jgi:rhodanese-related sulfurtransferase
MILINKETVMIHIRSFIIAGIVATLSLVVPAAAQDAPLEINGAKTVNAQQIFELVTKTPDIVILDNRKPEDFAVDAESLAKYIPTKDTPVLFYCNGVKCGRAAKATEKAVKLGYAKVYYYALGMDEWNAQRLPLVQAK